MAAKKYLGAGIVGALLLAMVLPSGAAPAAPADDPWFAYVASDGSHGVGRLSEVLQAFGAGDWHQNGFQHCYGTAPVEPGCTLQGYVKPFPGIYLVGWFPPTLPHQPDPIVPENGAFGSAGALVASTHLEVTGDMFPETKILYSCTWATAALYGSGPSVTPFTACKVTYIYPPGTPLSERYPRGNVTVDFSSGFYDASLADPSLPSTADAGPGVGTWHGVFYAQP